MRGESACRILAPVFWQVQLAIDEAMSLRRHVGEEDAHLAVFDASGGAAILWLDASGVAAAFGKATFIHNQHREGRRQLSPLAGQGRRGERLPEEGAQLIAHPFVIPDGVREQTLHAIRTAVFGVLSDLPAIFPGDLTDDGVQVEQGVTARLGARKTRRQALMQVAQAQRPSANLAQSWLGWLWCGMVMVLHAFLVSDGQLKQEVLVLLECHIGARIARSFFCSGENSRENDSAYKCHCSESAVRSGTIRFQAKWPVEPVRD